ncbi:VIT1/CCC1 transporter family protein [Paraburkholderia sp. SIMBA_054]|uniref:VIT1/CCC1 transporter family protein n=1 Tax=Paraburkholderia sp. SIMBA_054 TaxID=3085795 RepID=UPI00397DCE33
MLTAVAGLAAGAMSMATGDYVSVSSQADTEKSALVQEQAEQSALSRFAGFLGAARRIPAAPLVWRFGYSVCRRAT